MCGSACDWRAEAEVGLPSCTGLPFVCGKVVGAEAFAPQSAAAPPGAAACDDRREEPACPVHGQLSGQGFGGAASVRRAHAVLGSALRAVQAALAFVFLSLRVAAPPCAGGWTARVGSVEQRSATAAGPRGLRSHSLAGVCRTGAPSLGTRERSFPEPGSPALGLGSAPLALRGLWWRIVGSPGCACAHVGLSVASCGPGLPHRTVGAPRHVCADGWPFTDFGGLVGAPVCAPTASSWGISGGPGTLYGT